MFDHLICIRSFVIIENPKFDQNPRLLCAHYFSSSSKNSSPSAHEKHLSFRPKFNLSNLHRFLWGTKVANKVKVCKLTGSFLCVRSLWEHKGTQKVWKLHFSAKIPRFGLKVHELYALAEQRKNKVARRDSSQYTLSTHHT